MKTVDTKASRFPDRNANPDPSYFTRQRRKAPSPEVSSCVWSQHIHHALPARPRLVRMTSYTHAYSSVCTRLGHVSSPKLLTRISATRCARFSAVLLEVILALTSINIHVFPTSGNREPFRRTAVHFLVTDAFWLGAKSGELLICHTRTSNEVVELPPTRIFPECGVKSIP